MNLLIIIIFMLGMLAMRWLLFGWALWFVLAIFGVNLPFMTACLVVALLDSMHSILFKSKKKGE